jgi:DNA-binding transcriptional MocR family regulator
MTIWTPDLSPSDEPVYGAIVRALEQDMANGRLARGDRLPTHRVLAKLLGLSVGTITRAYAEAEKRGLVRGEVGRGTFVGGSDPHGHFPSEGGGPIDLALTWPLYGVDPPLGAALRELAGDSDVELLLRYGPHAGLPHHRAAGARWAGLHGIEVEPDRVFVCAGVQHVLAVALSALAEPGDVVLTESLTYPGMKAVAETLHLRLVGVEMDEEGLRPEALEVACRVRRPKALYTIPTIQNPTTAVMGAERRRDILRIARQYGVTVLEDDVHRLLHPDPPPSFAALAPDITYSAVSLSKSVCGGLRVAFLVAPPAASDRISRSLWAMTWMAAPLTAEIAARWIGDGTAAGVVARKRAEARARQAVAEEILEGFNFRTAPDAYHLWLDLPRPWRSVEFALECQRRGVSVSPAEAFAVGRCDQYRAVRLSLSGVEGRRELHAGLSRVAEVLRSAPGQTLSL